MAHTGPLIVFGIDEPLEILRLRLISLFDARADPTNSSAGNSQLDRQIQPLIEKITSLTQIDIQLENLFDNNENIVIQEEPIIESISTSPQNNTLRNALLIGGALVLLA